MSIDRNALHAEMTLWRRDLHAHPEFGFEERRTSAFVAQKLRDFGLDEVVEGVGGTGVVGTLRRGQGNRAIALRADMDALRITEQGDGAYRSLNAGVMHVCGHDGHTGRLGMFAFLRIAKTLYLFAFVPAAATRAQATGAAGPAWLPAGARKAPGSRRRKICP